MKWLSEQILNGTSAQLSCTVPFTLVHTGKYRTIRIKNTDNTETKHNWKKTNDAKHSKTKPSWFSCLLRHSARKRDWVILQRSRTHTVWLLLKKTRFNRAEQWQSNSWDGRHKTVVKWQRRYTNMRLKRKNGLSS